MYGIHNYIYGVDLSKRAHMPMIAFGAELEILNTDYAGEGYMPVWIGKVYKSVPTFRPIADLNRVYPKRDIKLLLDWEKEVAQVIKHIDARLLEECPSDQAKLLKKLRAYVKKLKPKKCVIYSTS